MRSNWRIVSAVFLSVCFAVLMIIHAQNRNRPGNEPDVNQFPIVDYDVEKNNPKSTVHGKKYHNKYAPRIGETSDGIFIIDDWEMGLPALPASRSSAVIIGEITDAQAHLSDDETTIYSEFTVRIERVVKKDTQVQLTVGNSAIIERVGGRVRLPSGKIVIAQTNHQDLPHVGKRYALFLTHEFSDGKNYDDFQLLTGYELRSGRVFPLDKLLPGHPITSYTDTSETLFLNDLAKALSN